MLSVVEPLACTTPLFPKIIGGNSFSDTEIYQIDVFNDNLALAAYSWDLSLAATLNAWMYAPIIAVIIMSSPGTQFKWAKAYDIDDSYVCVSYSNDGSYIVALTSSNGSIQVFNSNNGVLITSRQYSGGPGPQDFYIKTLIMSSASSAKAYVISKDSTTSSCIGSQVFSFNALTFSASARWAQKSNNCQYLGIAFWSNENTIYAYTYHSGALKVSRIDDTVSFSLQWTYGFTGSQTSSYSVISHKAIDSTKDMLVITGQQLANTYFGILIIPTTTPFAPTSSDVYYSSVLNPYDVKGAYIASEKSIKVLLYSSALKLTYLANLFLSGTTSYYVLQQTLPQMTLTFQTLGVFSSDGSKYYVSSRGYDFYTNLAIATQALAASGNQQAVIYSSDVTSAAYILSSGSPSIGSLSVVTSGITIQGNPYSNYVGFSFINDANKVMRTVALAFLNVPTWPLQQTLTINPVPQATNVLTFQPGTASTISLTLFTATLNCGTGATGITHTGLKTTGVAYVLATDNIGVDSAGLISITSSLTAGIYTLIIKGALTNGLSAQQIFQLRGNNLPVFSPTLTDQVVALQATQSYTLPSLSDVDGGQTPTIQTVSMGPGSFLTYASATKTISFAPTLPADVATHTVSVIVTDGMDSHTYTFTVTVNPPSPYFTTVLVSQTVKLGSSLIYSLPPIMNPATGSSSGATATYTTTLSYVVFNPSPSPGSLTINPPLMDFTNIGTATVGITLTGGSGSSEYKMNVIVTNSAPVFSLLPLVSTTIMTGKTKTYKLPSINDAEGHTPSITCTIPSSFITFDNVDTFTFTSPVVSDIATHTVTVTISDGNMQTSYTFDVIVILAINSPPVFDDGTTAFASLTVPLNSVQSFSVPSFSDPDNDPVTISVVEGSGGTLPAWIKLKNTNTLLEASPTAFTDLNTFSVKIVLTTSNHVVPFPFTITATNSAPVFSAAPLSSTQLYIGETKTYQLPSITDAEGHTTTITNVIPKSFITFDTVDTFTFTPTGLLDLGTYTVSITLSDGNMQTSYTFQVIVRSKPAFTDGTTSFSSPKVPLNSVSSFSVPSFSDPDGDAVTISIAEGSGGTLPAWIQLINTNTLVQATPIAFTDLGTYNVKIVLTTANEVISFPFTIIVTNTAPYFTSSPPTVLAIAYNSFTLIDLTNTYKDNENHVITLNCYFTLSGGIKTLIPSGIFSMPSAQQIQITPTSLADQGTYLLEYLISDGQPLSSIASTTVKVINNPPVFTVGTPSSFTVKINEIFDLILPAYADPEGSLVSVSIDATPAGIINTFAVVQPGQLVIRFMPNQQSQVQDYNAQITLSDGDKSSSYPLTISVTSITPNLDFLAPRFNESLIQFQNIPINTEREYTLPVKMTTDDLHVVHHKPLPKYAIFEFPKYKFIPALVSHLGIVQFKGTVKNIYGQKNFTLTLFVDNEPPKFKQIIPDQKVFAGTQINIQIPQIQDRENHLVYIKFKLNKKGTLPKFMKYDEASNIFKIEPSLSQMTGQFKISVFLTDQLGAQRIYSFKIKVINTDNILSYFDPHEDGKIRKNQAVVYIKKIKRDGEVKLKVYGEKNADKIVDLIRNESIQFFWNSSQQSEIINHTIISKDSFIREFEVKLNFSDPLQVSNQSVSFILNKLSQLRDNLQIKVLEQIVYNQSIKPVFILKNQTHEKSIPPQLMNSKMHQLIQFSKSESCKGAGRWQNHFNFQQVVQLPDVRFALLNIFRALLIQIIWMTFEDFSFLMMNTMLSLSVPGVAQIMQQVIVKFIFLDLLMTEKWIPRILDWIRDDDRYLQDDQALNDYFDENGFESKLFLKNIGQAMVFFLVYAHIWLFAGITKIVSRMFSLQVFFKKLFCIRTSQEKLKQKLMWKWSLIFFNSQSVPFMIASFINLQKIGLYDKVSGVCAILAFITVAMLILIVICIMRTLRDVKNEPNKLADKKFQGKFGLLINDLNLNPKYKIKNITLYWNWLILIRWIVTVFIFIQPKDYNCLQLFPLLIKSVLFQVLIIQVKPYQDCYQNRRAFFYEFANSIYLYILICITDFQGENTLRDAQGIALVIVISTVILFNLLRTLLSLIKWLYLHFYPRANNNFQPQRRQMIYKTKAAVAPFQAFQVQDTFSTNNLVPNIVKIQIDNKSQVSPSQNGQLKHDQFSIIDEEIKSKEPLQKPLQRSILKKSAQPAVFTQSKPIQYQDIYNNVMRDQELNDAFDNSMLQHDSNLRKETR